MRLRVPGGLSGWARSHPVLVALVLYTLLGVIFFGPGLLPGHTTSASDYLWSVAPWSSSAPSGLFVWSTHPFVEVGSNTQLVDPTTVFEPFLEYTRSQLPHIPLWDPYIMGGAPFLGDMQSAIFSPFSIPAYVLPFWWSLSVIAVMKVVVAAMGAFLLGRALNMRFAGAFMCGTVFGFGLFLIAWLPWPLASVFAFIPWMMLATEYVIRKPGLLSGSGLAAVVALQFFCGHPESSFQALFAVVCYFCLRTLQKPGGVVAAVAAAGRTGSSRLRAVYDAARGPVVFFVIAVALGAGIAGVVIVPFLELLRNSSDISSRPRALVHVQPKFFFASLLPSYYDRVGSNFLIEDAFYAGVLPLMLAVFALVRARVERIAVAIFGVLCIVVVLGIQPLFGFVGRLPGFDETYLSRLTILYLLCVALLAGWGLDDLVSARSGGKKAAVAWTICAGMFVAPFVIVAATRSTTLSVFARAVHVAWGFATEPLEGTSDWSQVIHLSALLVWIAVAVPAVVILYLRERRGLRPAIFAVLAIALVTGDLFQAGMGENPAIPESHAVQPATPAIRYLQDQTPARFVAVSPYEGLNPLPPDTNLYYGLYDARGYDLPVIQRFSNLWTRYVAPPTPLLPLDTPAVPILNVLLRPGGPAAMRVLSLLGVKDLLEQKGDSPLGLPGLHKVYDGPDATIYENDNAMPRVWLAGDQDVIRNAGTQLATVASAGFDPHDTVIAGAPITGIPSGGGSGGSPGNARITEYQAQQVTIEAHSDRPAELVLSDTYYPGWTVSVNGQPAAISEVDYLLRGVTVPAGDDRIVFSYHPRSFRLGVTASLAAIAVLMVAVIFGIRRRRPSRRGRHVRGAAPDSMQPGISSGEDVLNRSGAVQSANC
jgi:Bacterial membrane protein YfhO